MSELSIKARDAFNPQSLLKELQKRAQKEALGSVEGGSAVEAHGSFMDTLKNAFDSVNQAQLKAEQATTDLVLGRAENLHSVMIAMEKADLALRSAVSVRNKIIEAYQEIMRMPV